MVYNVASASPLIIVINLFIPLLSVLLWRRYGTSIRNVPGPFLASFSRLWHLKHIVKGDINLQCIALHEKHGHFVRIAHDEVSVSHPDGLRAVLLTPLRKAQWYKVLALPDYRFQSPMSELDPKRRVERSKNVASAYTLSNLIKSESYIDDAVKLLLGHLDTCAAVQQPVELDKWFNYLAFDIIGEVTFSKRFGFLEQGADIGGAISNSKALNAYIVLAGFFQTLHNWTLGNPILTKYKILPMGHIFDTTMRAISERLKNPRARYDMIEHWKKNLNDHPDRMSMRDLQAAATGTVGAGADTIATSLQSFVYHLCKNPNFLPKLGDEIDAARNQGMLASRVVSFSDSQKLPYLQACIKEALRCCNPVPFGLARIAPSEGVKIGNSFFPADTNLSINPWVIHYSTEIFGADANAFNPDRWSGPNSKELEKFFMPFGLGYNSCPGRHLAMIEISKVAATLVRDYIFRQVNPYQRWKWQAYFTCVPYDWPCLVNRRVEAADGSI